MYQVKPFFTSLSSSSIVSSVKMASSFGRLIIRACLQHRQILECDKDNPLQNISTSMPAGSTADLTDGSVLDYNLSIVDAIAAAQATSSFDLALPTFANFTQGSSLFCRLQTPLRPRFPLVSKRKPLPYQQRC